VGDSGKRSKIRIVGEGGISHIIYISEVRKAMSGGKGFMQRNQVGASLERIEWS